jgi:hypothetical protein
LRGYSINLQDLMALFKDKLLVPPPVKEFHPTPLAIIRFTNQGFAIDTIWKMSLRVRFWVHGNLM